MSSFKDVCRVFFVTIAKMTVLICTLVCMAMFVYALVSRIVDWLLATIIAIAACFAAKRAFDTYSKGRDNGFIRYINWLSRREV